LLTNERCLKPKETSNGADGALESTSPLTQPGSKLATYVLCHPTLALEWTTDVDTAPGEDQ